MSNHPKEPRTFTRTPIQVRVTGGLTFAVSVPGGCTSWAGMTATPDLEIQIRRALEHVDQCEVCQAGEPRHLAYPGRETR